jgi:PAS domain S-box-containing protein
MGQFMRRPVRETTPGAPLLDAEGDDPLAAGARRLQAMIESRFGRVQADARDGTILACSASFAALLGMDRADLVGRRLPDLISPPGEDAWADIAAAAASAPEISATLAMRHADGRALRLRVHVGLVDGAPGEPQAVLLVEDVTGQVEVKARIEDDLRRLELALRGSRDGIWDWDVITGDSHFSDQMYRLLGYEPQEFPGTYEEWISRIHPDDRGIVAAAVRRHLDEDLPAYRLEYRMQTKDGSYRWFQSRGEAQWDDSGRPVRIAGSFTDITESKEFEQALEATRAFTLAVLGSLSAQIAVIDPTGMIVAVNAAWSNYGAERASFVSVPLDIGTNYFEAFEQSCAEDDSVSARVLAGIKDVLAGRRAEFRVEYRCPSKAARRWFVTTVTPLSIALGGAVIAHDDITAIKQAELALAESQGRLNMTLEAAKIVAWEIDVATGAIHEVGPVGDLVGRPAGFRHANARAFLRTVHRDDRRRLAETLLGAARDGRSFELDFRIPLAAGERWLLVKGRAARDEHNRPIKLLGIARDITEQHKAATTQQLLVSELNHRVKNMLAVVQSLATQTEGATRSVEEFQRAFALRLQALGRSHDLLTRDSWSGAQLSDIAREALAPYGHVRGASVRFDVAGPPVRLSPHAAVTLGMVFNELATNAAKYGAFSTSAGSVAVRWSIAPEVAGGAQTLELAWVESGGPEVRPPSQRGFGSLLITRAPIYELGARVELEFLPAGLQCRLALPLPRCMALD